MNNNIVMGYVYILVSPSGKRYAGQTTRGVEERMIEHASKARRGCLLPIHSAIRKYGENIRVEYTMSFRCTQQYLDYIEDQIITVWNTLVPDGYNIKRGGGCGAHGEETKAKISAFQKSRIHGPTSEETRKKMSLSQMGKHKRGFPGKPLSEESKAKLSALWKGRVLSEETKAKISAAKMGHPGYFKGRHHSEEAKIKISTANRGRGKGKPRSVETRSKISMNSARKGKPAWNKGKHIGTKELTNG